MRNYFITLLIAFAFLSCSTNIYLHRIKVYLNASTAKTKSKYLSEDYHSFFEEKKGEGKNKTAAIKSFLEWDAPLHPDIQILNYTVNGNEWKVKFNEQNDFTKPIGFPGWKGTEIIRFNSRKEIEEVFYIPDPDNPPYKKWLQPAVNWLQKNKPEELNEVYKDEKLVQTSETAKKWAVLLQFWQKETSKKK
jgi:hypothetical protein